MAPDRLLPAGRPSRALSIAVSAALVVVWGTIRLVLFDTTMFPLTYALPLLVCVWTRHGVALWTMAAVFIAFHAVKLFWLIPPGTFTPDELWTNFGATVANISVGAVAVQLILRLRDRLDAALDDVREQADELRMQGEELATQNEELTSQAEELSQQGEELNAQNEELQSQAEEIGSLNEALARRERLLEALLDMAREAPTEAVALEHIARATLDLYEGVAIVAIYERTGDGLTRRACVHAGTEAREPEGLPAEALVTLVADENRTAAIDDLSLRPDLAGGTSGIGAVLAAPIHVGDEVAGAFVVYGARARTWSGEEFRLAEWLAGHSGRVLLALRLQTALRDSDRRKGEFLATLSHELRNPLAPMRYALELLETGREHDSKALPILKRQFQQLVRLVDDLLDVTRLSSNKIRIRKARTDLSAIVRHAVDACRPDVAAAAHALTLNVPQHPVWVDADAARMAQVVTNLVNNAVRYTPSGGRVEVTLTPTPEHAVLRVKDSGRGLAAGDLERVFDMFTQVGGPGTEGLGVGLALVRTIIELHGGRVQARSEGLSRGSEFEVTLPRVGQAAAEEAPCVTPPAADAPRRVLVVDDNVDSAALMAALLEHHGHHVQVAHCAKAALQIGQQFQPDVALLDIGLPDADGYSLARQLREARDGEGPLRLVALTGWGQHADRERARAAGFDAHLTKPADLQAVLDALRPHAAAESPKAETREAP